LIGLVAAYMNHGAKAFISDVSVNKLCWGQGIAKHLLSMCIDEASQSRCQCLELDVSSSNMTAIALYTSFDFETYHSDSSTQKMRLVLTGVKA
jgi:ribosomal protein S18 acetylase RimI-like enzyme